MIKECIIKLGGLSRYATHCRIDNQLSAMKRSNQRRWHAVVLDHDYEAFAGCIRTTDPMVVASVPAIWSDVPVAVPGVSFKGLIQFVPRWPEQFRPFRADDEYARGHVVKRLVQLQTFTDSSLQVRLVGRSPIFIDKATNQYGAPSAFFQVEGVVKNKDSLSNLILDGIGGSRAFGVGKLIGSTSVFYPFIVKAVEQIAEQEGVPA